MLANELIDRLERLGLLDQEIIEALREQLEQGGTRVTPEAVAKLLVDNGQLTHFQATKLIGELRSGQYDEEQATDNEEDDLTAGLDDLVAEPDEPEEAIPVVEAANVYEAEVVAAEPVEVEAVPVEAAVDDSAPAVPRERPKPSRKKPDPQKSVWDSFKVYGYLGIIALLVLGGLGIWFVLSREDADAFIAEANKLYDQQNYQGAQDLYLSFLNQFGEDHQYSSRARTCVTMTELYKAAQFKQEPWQAVDLAKEKLPLIAEEEGMNEERANLAGLMVDIASNLAGAAGRAKETEQKKSLLEKLDEHRELMDEPMYVSSTMKVTLAGQIQNVEEARARVQRDINRNEELDASEALMQEQLAAKETKKSYDTRDALLRKFPELHDHERLVTLIREASEIQQTLVKPSAELPKTVTDAPAGDSLKAVVLTSLAGREVPDLRGETLYFRVYGSILAFDGENGKLRWRKFVGYSEDLPPVRLEDGVLLSESANLEVFRCAAQDGAVAWRTQVGEPFSLPISANGSVYVSTDSGRLISLDADSGDAKWAAQIPQPLETGPGVDERANRAYVSGNHSNLYLLNTRDGSCLESYYIGHKPGTIAVPPIPLLGHLFVIENAGSDYANVHVLRVDETGGKLSVAQPLFRLTGNVRVPPIIQGRRLIVLTDRGEVVVYDIEPTAEREQVSVAATLPAFYENPTETQMAVGRSQMWITGTRIGRYELQINTGRVVRDWSIHELDQFIGQPYASDETLVHARVLRGTTAVRVTAAVPKTGEELWHTDVGVPVSMLKTAPGGKGLHVITSQASLFELGREALADGSTTGPIENPGAKAVAIRFEGPVRIDDAWTLMLNKAGGQSMLLYDPQRAKERLRQLTMRLPAGKPSGGSVVSGGGLFLPLDSGRAVLIDWRTGASKATPFQPPSDPVGKVQWSAPVPMADDPDQVVLTDSRKKIYRLRVAEQIKELASKDIDRELLGPATRVGGTMFGTAKGPAADYVVGFEMATLEKRFETLLSGRVLWGPVTAGELCLVVTDDQFLRAFAADGSLKFEVKVPEGIPVGQAVAQGNTIVVNGGISGWLVAVNSDTGQIIGRQDLGQPISATPLMIGQRLLVPGVEGVVYISQVPSN